jgi:hypothetical protein
MSLLFNVVPLEYLGPLRNLPSSALRMPICNLLPFCHCHAFSVSGGGSFEPLIDLLFSCAELTHFI